MQRDANEHQPRICERVTLPQPRAALNISLALGCAGLLLTLLTLTVPYPGVPRLPWIAGYLVVGAYGFLLWFRLRRMERRFTLCIDNEHIIVIEQSGPWEIATAIPIANICDLRLLGGSFWTGPIEARVKADDILVRKRTGRTLNLKKSKRTKLPARTFHRHPRLLECLIDLAEPFATTRSRRNALERARRYHRAESKSVPVEPPDYIPTMIEWIGKPGEPFPRAIAAVFRGYLVVLGLAFAGFIVSIIACQAGWSLAAIFPILLLNAVGSWRMFRPIRRLGRATSGFVLADIVCGMILLLTALLILFHPIVQVLALLYLVALILKSTRLGFGWKVQRIVRYSLLFFLPAFGLFAFAYFGNWPPGRSKTIFRLSYRAVFPYKIIVTPNENNLAVLVGSAGDRDDQGTGEYVRVRDPLLKGASTKILLGFHGSFRQSILSSRYSVLFKRLFGQPESSELVLRPIVDGKTCDCGVWSPDSRRLPIVVPLTTQTCEIWLADAEKRSVEPVCLTSNTLMLFRDTWSTDGLTLKGLVVEDNESTESYSLLNYDLQSDALRIEHLSRLTDYRTSPPQPSTQYPPWPSSLSPDVKWLARPERTSDSLRVKITRQPDGKVVSQFSIPASEREFRVLWSPDSRKLAVAGLRRIWVHGLDSGSTTCIRAWRRHDTVWPIWSPDSRSIYYSRYVALSFLGMEIIRVTLKE